MAAVTTAPATEGLTAGTKRNAAIAKKVKLKIIPVKFFIFCFLK
jgi:hypothetical protein